MEEVSFVPGLEGWQHIDRQRDGTRVDKVSEVGKVIVY